MASKKRIIKVVFLLPVIVYSIFLIFLPLLYIFTISFYKSDSYGGMIHTITFENYWELFDAVYVKIFLQSFIIAIITTIICVLIAYPFVLAVSHKKKQTQQV